ncbi:MAG: DUF192 domain-containing protein [Halobacteriales archaeon]
MELVHRPGDGSATTLASDVEMASSRLAKARGLMLRRDFEGALVFPFDRVARRSVHMVGVLFPIDVVWTVSSEVTAVRRLSPFIGLGRARADRIVELPAGTAAAVAVGDRLELVED